MSKIIDQLKKIEQAKYAGESAGVARRKTSREMTVALDHLKEVLSLREAHEHGKGAHKSRRLLEEFKRLEKELLELREEEDEVLSSIREILEGPKKPAKKRKKR